MAADVKGKHKRRNRTSYEQKLIEMDWRQNIPEDFGKFAKFKNFQEEEMKCKTQKLRWQSKPEEVILYNICPSTIIRKLAPFYFLFGTACTVGKKVYGSTNTESGCGKRHARLGRTVFQVTCFFYLQRERMKLT